MNNITGILVTGGKSSRMNKDKALLDFNGKMMGQWTANILQQCCEKVLVVSNNEDHKIFGDQLVQDKIGDGPIAGLYAGLLESLSDWNVVLPCDTPYMTVDVINQLWDNKKGFDAVVAVDSNDKVHTLIGLYNRNILELVQEQIESNRYSMMNILDRIKVNLVRFEKNHAFKNINTKEDL